MDKYINQIFSSSSWSDVDVKEIPYWACCGSEQPNKALLGSVVAVDEHEDTSSPTYLTNSYNSLESWVAQDVSSVLQDFEPDAQDGGKNCEVQNMGMQYGVDGNMVRTSLPSIAPENVGCSSFEPPIFPGFNGDFETLSPISQVWRLQSYEGVPSAIIPGIGEHQMGSFGMNRDYGDNDIYSIASNHNNPAALVSTEKGMHDIRNYPLPSFSSAPCMDCRLYHSRAGTLSSRHYRNLHLRIQNTTAPAGECARTGKPLMRAHRGQATDPHSIAERLRREKIADRMKNLQELVPNSNKTDKASMLDEIIEYVRLLQLQVKELSMSKIGASGAVVPLITDSKGCQTKVKNGLPQLPSIGQEADISFDETDLEQVVKLIESDANKAMQHLKSKGFCLMPVALADAISTATESSSSPPAPVSDDWQKKKTGFAGVARNNSSSSSNSSGSPDQVQR